LRAPSCGDPNRIDVSNDVVHSHTPRARSSRKCGDGRARVIALNRWPQLVIDGKQPTEKRFA
jgi:hypothetical protein